ncbi:MAG TPA: DNA polymerase ligase N-terminal domain-containing protein [Chitinophagaceae bacterium]|nr:DNA polymerase ligase N-terminal domain-containing protein [Chitinophagaceae bacterium]
MALSAYHKKRNFKNTPEPRGDAARSKSFRFVVQRHNASHLHYDFRLELGGVLKSWAVPKGPSMNPADKRLAVMVEDHPSSYIYFEGTIPEGNYGAGTVEVWDKGLFFPVNKLIEKISERQALQDLSKGELKFVMMGDKLQGEFVLVRLKDEKNWLLIKHKDEYALSLKYNPEKYSKQAKAEKKKPSKENAGRKKK